MNNFECQKLISQLLGNDIISSKIEKGCLYIEIRYDKILKALTILATNSAISFSSLFDLFAVDYRKKHGSMNLYYQLHSFTLDISIFALIKVQENSEIQSATLLFNNAEWYEREAFEKFGIKFLNHLELRPIFLAS